jgi:hypothetical protein
VLIRDLGSEQKLEELLAVTNASFEEVAALSNARKHEIAKGLAQLSKHVVRGASRKVTAAAYGNIERGIRLAVTTFVLVGFFSLGTYVANQRTNLATDTNWRASSSNADCRPISMGGCAPLQGIFFHTKEDESPWIEYDLGVRTKFTRIIVENARDGLRERAEP